ncbi:MAG: UDP-N-acetylmuramoyl-L-alanine--D-glutamate ligase [Chloroflexi bacterium]|nr:UDP-N-acetylmuramoyl-L-alanine--D-glutamate ligase [Chloroflexota bacterium]
MKSWNGLRILILGGARQGLALARFLARHGAQVTINDQHPAEQMQAAQTLLEGLPVHWVLGGHPSSLLDETDLMCLSGGIPLTIPLVVEASRRGLPISNDSQIFMEAVPCRVIGITGSAGKTTTTTLVGRMAASAIQAPHKSWVGGNIGTPLIDHLEEISSSDLVILELSSFQLEQMTISPQIAAVLNITPNHLDRHGTLEAYTTAKARLLAFQSPTGIAVLGRDDLGAWNLTGQVHGRLVSFGLSRPLVGQAGSFYQKGWLVMQDGPKDIDLMPHNLIQLRGEHNLQNVLAACAIAWVAGFPVEAMQEGVKDFAGVAHRLEFIRSLNGADWFNDSIATAPERTMAAIHSFDNPLVLLLGGRDKDLPWGDLADLVHQRVDHVVVFGEAAEKVMQALGTSQPGHRPYTLAHCTGLQEAVQAAAAAAEPGDVILLSPGGTSFDEFKDFEERGECFQTWVNQLS